jgi:hypothetical protein
MAAATGAVLADANEIDNELDSEAVRAKKKFKLSSVFNKLADIGARAAVTNTLKIAAVTFAAGLGASSIVSIGVASVAAGLGSALYVYGKEAVKDLRAGSPVNWSDKERIKKVRNALLIGVAGGAFGAWLGQTEFFKAGIEFVKDHGIRAFSALIPAAHAAQEGPVAVGESMMPPEVINAPRPPADIPGVKTPAAVKLPVLPKVQATELPKVNATELPKVHVEPQPKAVVTHNPVKHVVKAPARLPVKLPSAEAITAGAADAKDANNVLGRVWEAAMQSDQAKGKFMAELLRADPDNLNSVSPQYLKDRAHDVLRLKDIPVQQRLQLAHDLAAEAKARGNKQAVQFLKDLVKLGYVETPAPVADVPVAAIPAATVAEVAPAPLPATVVQPAPEVKTFFTEAASCNVAADSTVACTVNAETMKPGDYVGFTDAANPAVKAFTPLAEGSTEVPTQAFLHEKLVADGVARITAFRTAIINKITP